MLPEAALRYFKTDEIINVNDILKLVRSSVEEKFSASVWDQWQCGIVRNLGSYWFLAVILVKNVYYVRNEFHPASWGQFGNYLVEKLQISLGKSTLIGLAKRNANHITPSYCYLPLSCRSIIDRCGLLGICKPQIAFQFNPILENRERTRTYRLEEDASK